MATTFNLGGNTNKSDESWKSDFLLNVSIPGGKLGTIGLSIRNAKQARLIEILRSENADELLQWIASNISIQAVDMAEAAQASYDLPDFG